MWLCILIRCAHVQRGVCQAAVSTMNLKLKTQNVSSQYDTYSYYVVCKALQL